MNYSIKPEDVRVEKKFVARADTLTLIQNWIQHSPEHFREVYEPRWVNNIYFDSHDYSAYEENLTGTSQRVKLRYRWYGDRDLRGPGAAELKFKRNDFGWKFKVPVDIPMSNHSPRYIELHRILRKQGMPSMTKWFDRFPFAVLTNRYYRRYYVSANQQLRITLDTHLKSFDQRFASRVSWTRTGVTPSLLIVELKFAREHRKVAVDAMVRFPLRSNRHSKYVTGLQSITSN